MPIYKMLVNANFDQLRVAIIDDKGVLEQVDFESLNNNNNLGNIYKGTITAIEPSLQASFVEYGGNRHGFLPFNEIHHRYYTKSDRRLSVQDRLKVGQEVILQVAREEIGMKGAYLTTYLSLPGQYLVMMPLTNKVGISRKIEAPEERKSLRQIMDQITVPDGMGYIIRTAGLGRTREQLQRDLNLLTTTWGELENRHQSVSSPALLYEEDDVVTRTIRDYFNEDVTQILIDDKSVYETVHSYFKKMMPSFAHIVKLYKNKTPLLSKFRLDDHIESIFSSKITLPSGGSIVIEQTEALVVIDVNSGKTAEGNLEATALKSNLEAAEEVARQLRLRDLGGLIVIDFIDLKERRHASEVEQRLRDCIKKDKARITALNMSRFGLLEMSRQRISTSKQIRHYVDCPTCSGLGRIKSQEMRALDVLARARQLAQNRLVKEVTILCADDLAFNLLNERRVEIVTLEGEHDVSIRVNTKPGFTGKPTFETVKRSLKEEKEAMVMPAPLSLSTMAASMSEKAINEQKDYREEKLDALDKLTFEELRGVEVPVPGDLNPFEKFNMSVRITLMKRHGLYEGMMEDFKKAIRDNVIDTTQPVRPKKEPANQDAEETSVSESENEEEKRAAEDQEVKSKPSRPKRERTRSRRGRAPRSASAGAEDDQSAKTEHEDVKSEKVEKPAKEKSTKPRGRKPSKKTKVAKDEDGEESNAASPDMATAN